MRMKDIIDFQKNNRVSEEEYEDYMNEIANYLNQKTEEGKKIVLERLSEENFVRLVRQVKQSTITSMLSQGYGTALGMSEVMEGGVLDGFCHTTILGVLAILVEEEVL